MIRTLDGRASLAAAGIALAILCTGHRADAQATPAPSPAASAMPAATAMPSPAASAMPAATAMPVPAAPAAQNVPPMNFGAPPSGQIPILYNDHHVYTTPDELKRARVLAALVRGGTILIPLRSMFEQMGATVSWDPATRTADVTKPGSDVKVTVGKPVVVINGETRPLDVPPEIYHGVVVVPVRVISEGMGAYVQWVPDKRLVVVRYLPATPPPPPPPPPATPAPTPTPTPVAAPFMDHFVSGDYIISPKVYNELSPGNTGNSSFMVKGAFEFNLFSLPLMIKGDFRQIQYAHNAELAAGQCDAGAPTCQTVVGHDPNYQPGLCPSQGDPGCVTVVGFQQTQAVVGLGQAYIPAFRATENDVDGRIGIKVLDPRIYIGGGYYWKHYNYLGYPNIEGWGFGLDKLPDLDQPFSVYGSVWYYPSIRGTYTYPTSVFLGPLSGSRATLAYNAWKYDAGITFNFGKSPIFFEGGWQGEYLSGRTNAPINTTQNGGYVGLGLHF